MRRRLVLVFLAVSTTVALAFVVPLALLVRSTTEDRALDRARSSAAALAPVLATTSSVEDLTVAIGATRSGAAERVTVFFSDDVVVGADVEPSGLVRQALDEGRSAVGGTAGGKEVVAAVALSDGRTAVVRVFVPDDELVRGQTSVWLILGGVAIVLVGVAVFVADQLARTIVRPSEELAAAAVKLGDGDLDVRVDPEGPDELQAIATAFNELALRLTEMLEREREMVAELSHRLRTPLTKLRLDVDRVDDPVEAGVLLADVDAVTSTLNVLIEEARRTADRRGHQRCNAIEVVRERVAFWSALADEEDRSCSFDSGQNDGYVAISAGDLEAVLDVLLENVFSHTAEGIGFGVEVQRDGEMLLITVHDEGPGVPPDFVEKGRSGSGSTGLGLGIAQRTAEEAGGSFAVRPGVTGACFEVRLPLIPS